MMADSTTHERRLTGDEILSELLRNLEAGIFKIRYTALAPCIFHVYLHPEDHAQIRAVIPALQAEARRTLSEHLEALNGKNRGPAIVRMLGLDAGKRIEYKILESDWTIDFHPDLEGRLQRGEIEIYSDLGTEPRPEFGDGAMTTLITRRDSEGHTSTQQVPAPDRSAAFATLTYEEEGRRKTFNITKDLIVIGRGGKTFWVDVKLSAPSDVSREHCRIRRDPATNQFFLKNVSQLGTTLDGAAVPCSLDRSGDSVKDSGVEVPLPRKAQIGLAGVVVLDFEAS